MRQAAATTLDMVRHGEIATPDLLCADREEPLSDKGRAQLERLKQNLGWDLIISSPSARCRDFAKDLSNHLTLPLDLDSSWQEIDFGAWTGITRQSIWETDKESLLQLWSSPLEFCAPGGESMVDFVRRIQSAFARLLHKHQGKHILLLTHAGVIRSILASALDIDNSNTQKFNVEYAKINRLRAYPDGEFSLLNWNCSAGDLA